MTIPANLTFTDVQTRVMNSLRIPTSNTTEATKIGYLINEVYRDIAAKQDWWWLLKWSPLNTSPQITSGTVALTQNSTAITFSTAPQQFSVNVSVAGFRLIIPGQANNPLASYRIATHVSGATAATLDGAYTDSTNAAIAFNLYQDTYSLPTDTQKVLAVRRYGEWASLRRVGIEEMNFYKQFDQTVHWPEAYAIFDFATIGDPTSARQIQFHPYPDKAYRTEVYYKQMLNTEVSGTTRFFIPDDFVQVLIYGALARGYPIFLNDKDRGTYYQTLFNDMMALMSAQQREYARDQAGVAPDDTYRVGRRPRRSGQVTLGSWFDRLPSVP